MMYCNKCGKPLESDAHFCPQCRVQLEQMLAEDKGKRRKKKRPILWIALAAAILVAATVGMIAGMALGRMSAKPEMPENPEQPTEAVEWVCTETRYLDAGGNVTRRVLYRFDDNGFNVGKTTLDATGNMTEDTVFTCDGAGRHIQAVTTYSANHAFRMEGQVEKWGYDDYGNKVWYDCRKAYGSPIDSVSILRETYEYTYRYHQWMWARTERYTGQDEELKVDTKLEQTHIGTADYEGNTMTATWLHGDESVYYYVDYTYDEYGNTLKEERYDVDHSLHSTTTYKWADGKVTNITTTDENGEVSSSVERTYDENGNLVRILDRNGKGEIISDMRMVYAPKNRLPEENKEKGR